MNENNFLNLKGKKIIILGGAGLLGKEIYKKLYELGSIPVIVDSNKKKIIKVFEELKQKKKRSTLFSCRFIKSFKNKYKS